MGTYQQENNPWSGVPSEQVFWYGEPHQPYPQQNTIPVYTQPGQYQQPNLYQPQNQAYWNPNTSFPHQPFAPAIPSMVQQQPRISQDPQSPARMPKTQAQSLARNVKKGVLVSSLAIFGVLTVLVAGNLRMASPTPSPPNQITDPSQSNTNDPNAGNYFQHGRGGGYGFGNNDSGQNPGTSTGAS